MRVVHSFMLPMVVGFFGCQGAIGDSEGGRARGVGSGGASVGSNTTTGGTNPGATGVGGTQPGNPTTGDPGMPLDCSKASVGVAPLRRLTRSEYAGSVETL